MEDRYGRTIDYMRVSITDRCNLRCRYCMPKGISWLPMEEILTLEEIREACAQAAKIGISKIKITGGEPLVRKGCMRLIGMLKGIPGIRQVTLTTNGVLLSQYARELYENGIDGINISLDTLDEKEYAKITGFDGLGSVLHGIEEMEKYPVPIKINAVLQKEREHRWRDLTVFMQNRKLDVRFIEMMPIGYGKKFEVVSNEYILQQIREEYGEVEREETSHGNGPAVYYKIPGFLGSVGFISAVHGKFCSQCNRIRLTATGQLKSCLCYDGAISIREALRSGQKQEVQRLMRRAVLEKPKSHCFEDQSKMTEIHEMVKIGG